MEVLRNKLQEKQICTNFKRLEEFINNEEVSLTESYLIFYV